MAAASTSTATTMLYAVMVTALIRLVTYLYNLYWLRPERLRNKLRQQGVRGPKPSFFFGNVLDMKKIQAETVTKRAELTRKNVVHHESLSHVFPHMDKWMIEYGSTYTFTLWSMVILSTTDVELVKELTVKKSADFGRSSYVRESRGHLLGHDGIVCTKGATWSKERKIIHPEFFPLKVKGMVEKMIETATSMVGRWEAKVTEEGGIATIQVDDDLRNLSSELISKTCFGNNYARGKEVFTKMLTLLDVLSNQFSFVGLPGFRFIPIKSNREAWRLGKEIETSILNLVKIGDNDSTSSPDNLLQILTKNYSDSESRHLIVDNCKAMFFAGYESTATSIAFALVLLAHHKDWQTRLQTEVRSILQDHDQILTGDKLKKMKTLNMVVHEVIRLYPPTPFITRETNEEMKLGDIMVPKGVHIYISLLALHRDPAVWGDDANEFNPKRFANGLSNASKIPQLFIPFGMGIRTCVGQHYATQELKVALCLILSKFSFTLAPQYQHSVVYKMFYRPENAVYLKMERI